MFSIDHARDRLTHQAMAAAMAAGGPSLPAATAHATVSADAARRHSGQLLAAAAAASRGGDQGQRRRQLTTMTQASSNDLPDMRLVNNGAVSWSIDFSGGGAPAVDDSARRSVGRRQLGQSRAAHALKAPAPVVDYRPPSAPARPSGQRGGLAVALMSPDPAAARRRFLMNATSARAPRRRLVAARAGGGGDGGRGGQQHKTQASVTPQAPPTRRPRLVGGRTGDLVGTMDKVKQAVAAEAGAEAGGDGDLQSQQPSFPQRMESDDVDDDVGRPPLRAGDGEGVTRRPPAARVRPPEPINRMYSPFVSSDAMRQAQRAMADEDYEDDFDDWDSGDDSVSGHARAANVHDAAAAAAAADDDADDDDGGAAAGLMAMSIEARPASREASSSSRKRNRRQSELDSTIEQQMRATATATDLPTGAVAMDTRDAANAASVGETTPTMTTATVTSPPKPVPKPPATASPADMLDALSARVAQRRRRVFGKAARPGAAGAAGGNGAEEEDAATSRSPARRVESAQATPRTRASPKASSPLRRKVLIVSTSPEATIAAPSPPPEQPPTPSMSDTLNRTLGVNNNASAKGRGQRQRGGRGGLTLRIPVTSMTPTATEPTAMEATAAAAGRRISRPSLLQLGASLDDPSNDIQVIGREADAAPAGKIMKKPKGLRLKTPVVDNDGAAGGDGGGIVFLGEGNVSESASPANHGGGDGKDNSLLAAMDRSMLKAPGKGHRLNDSVQFSATGAMRVSGFAIDDQGVSLTDTFEKSHQPPRPIDPRMFGAPTDDEEDEPADDHDDPRDTELARQLRAVVGPSFGASSSAAAASASSEAAPSVPKKAKSKSKSVSPAMRLDTTQTRLVRHAIQAVLGRSLSSPAKENAPATANQPSTRGQSSTSTAGGFLGGLDQESLSFLRGDHEEDGSASGPFGSPQRRRLMRHALASSCPVLQVWQDVSGAGSGNANDQAVEATGDAADDGGTQIMVVDDGQQPELQQQTLGDYLGRARREAAPAAATAAMDIDKELERPQSGSGHGSRPLSSPHREPRSLLSKTFSPAAAILGGALAKSKPSRAASPNRTRDEWQKKSIKQLSMSPVPLERRLSAVNRPQSAFVKQGSTVDVAPLARRRKSQRATLQSLGLSISPDDLVVFESELGRGVTSSVRKAFFLPTMSLVALKSLNAYNKDHRHQLKKELRAFAALSGQTDDTVKFIGAFYHDGRATIALEYCDRGSLQQMIHDHGPMSDNDCRHIARCITRGLSLLHASKQLHRDLKPGNILLTSQGQCKIADFGLAKQLDASTDLSKTISGTLAFFSPERVMGDNYSFPADIWALGLILIYVATGAIAVENSEYWTLITRYQKGKKMPSLPDVSPVTGQPYPDDFRAFVDACLVFDAAERGTAQSLLEHPFLKLASPEQFTWTWTRHLPLDSEERAKLREASRAAEDAGAEATPMDTDAPTVDAKTNPSPRALSEAAVAELRTILMPVVERYYPSGCYTDSVVDRVRFMQIARQLNLPPAGVAGAFGTVLELV